MILGSAEWDRREFSESNLHVCDRDDTKTRVYNMKRCTKRGDWKKSKKFRGRRLRTLA